MHFYKIAGAMILVLSGCAGAWFMNSAASRSLSQTEAFISFLRFVRIQIECFAMPAGEIILRCDRTLLEECGLRGEPLPTTLDELVGRCAVRDSEVGEVLRGFASSFGKGYRDEQLRECDYYLGLLCDRRQKMSEELPRKKKLNSTLCICWALALVILFL